MRLEVPVQRRVLWGTGDVLLWADLELLLKDNSGTFHRRTFRVDTDLHSAPVGPPPRTLLQPLTLIDRLHFSFDHDPADGTMYGRMVVDQK